MQATWDFPSAPISASTLRGSPKLAARGCGEACERHEALRNVAQQLMQMRQLMVSH